MVLRRWVVVECLVLARRLASVVRPMPVGQKCMSLWNSVAWWSVLRIGNSFIQMCQICTPHPGYVLRLDRGFIMCSAEKVYRVTRRVFSEPVTSKLHLLYTKNLAGQLKTPKVIRISAMHANFSHSPVHSGPICFHMTKNLKLPSGTNKTK